MSDWCLRADPSFVAVSTERLDWMNPKTEVICLVISYRLLGSINSSWHFQWHFQLSVAGFWMGCCCGCGCCCCCCCCYCIVASLALLLFFIFVFCFSFTVVNTRGAKHTREARRRLPNLQYCVYLVIGPRTCRRISRRTSQSPIIFCHLASS